MKRILVSLLLLVPVALWAQIPQEEALKADIQENIWRAGMNMDPYEYLPGVQTPAPKGYQPFYISHYGRHGSRSNWGGKFYEYVQSLWTKAAEGGVLTPEGLAAKEQIDEAIRLHDNMDGRLTPLGAQEHRQIAGRMYEHYPEVFKKGSKRLTARSSTVPRVLVSMAAFTGELLSRQGDLQISWDTGEEIMKLVSTDSPKSLRDTVNRILAKRAKEFVPDTAAFQKRVFTDPVKARELTGDPVQLMLFTFNMGSTCAAFGLDDRLFRLFSLDELCHYEQDLAIDFYLRQCNSAEFGDQRMGSVNPLISDIIELADAAIATGETAADLRFGHDFQLLALGARLGLEGVGNRYTQEECVSWPGWRYTPFAGNIQLIFFRDKKGNVLVKPLLNERETRIIGLEGGPYYTWEAIKGYLKENWPKED